MSKPSLGKFQYNESQEESEIIYQHTLNDQPPSFGDAGTFGWYALVVAESLSETEKTVCAHPAYLCEEDSQGFFFITPYESPVEAMRAYGDLEIEWDKFNKDAE